MAVGTGEVVLDFGTGACQVSTSVARSSVAAATTQVEAYLFPKATADHSVDEQMIDPPQVYAHDVVDGVGFTVTALTPPSARSLRVGPDYLRGKYTVRWVATE